MRPRAAFAFVSLCSLGALAQPQRRAFTRTDPPFTVTLPAGFEAFTTENPAESLLGCFRRFSHGPSQPPTVLLLVHLGEEVPQRALREAEIEALRRTDPPPFRFVDRRVRVNSLGFELDALRGEGREGAQSAVRFATAVPLEGPAGVDSVLVTVIAPMDRADEADRVFRVVLGGMRARSSWRTPGQLLRATVQQVSGALALALSLGYLFGALALWRTQPRWERARAVVLGVAGLSWAVYALGFVIARPERQWAFAAQSALLAVAFAWQSRVVARPRR